MWQRGGADFPTMQDFLHDLRLSLAILALCALSLILIVGGVSFVVGVLYVFLKLVTWMF